MKIETIKEENRIILKVEGRIDTNTSREFQSELLLALQKQNEVIADLNEVDYVSSAGLRAMLIAYKAALGREGSFSLRNVHSNVKEILDMSGFSRFIHIEA